MLSSEWLCRVTDPGQVLGLETSVGWGMFVPNLEERRIMVKQTAS